MHQVDQEQWTRLIEDSHTLNVVMRERLAVTNEHIRLSKMALADSYALLSKVRKALAHEGAST